VNLLVEFLPAKHLYITTEDGELDREPLALMLKKAVEARREQRAAHLRRLGDTALYVSGFFPGSTGRLVDVDYYMAMGSQAYDSLSEMYAREPVAMMYRELSHKFDQCVHLIGEISDDAIASSDQGLIQVYARYLRTGSPRLRGVLIERGIPMMGKPSGPVS